MKRKIRTSPVLEKHRKTLNRVERSIRTIYYQGKRIVKITRSRYAFTAVPRCISHMQVNEYSATLAEVFDLTNGDLHAVIRRYMSGEIRIIFKREVKEGS